MFKFFYNLLNFSFYLLENVMVLLFFRLEVLYSFIIMIFCEKLYIYYSFFILWENIFMNRINGVVEFGDFEV